MQLTAAQFLRHLTGFNTQCKPFNQGAFPDTGSPTTTGYFAAAAEDVDHQVNFVITAQNRVQLILSCQL